MKEVLTMQREYFLSGATRPLSFRLDALHKLRKAILDYYPQIVEAFKKDYNKSEFEVAATEVSMVLGEIDYFLHKLKRLVRPRKVATSLTNYPAKGYVVAEPYGCTLVVSPWNYPLNLSLAPLVGSLAAGNTAILKLSSKTPNVSETIIQLLKVFDPKYVAVQPLEQRSEEIFSLDFDYVFYTGSAEFAKRVLALQAPHLTPVSLELGGKCPCIVDKAADVDIAAKRIAWGKFLNGGQTCVAPDFVAVHSDVKDIFLKKLISYTKRFYPDNAQTLTNVVTEEKVRQLLSLIQNEKVLLGGTADGRALSPTIVTDVAFDSPLMQEEIFGGVLPVLAFDNLDALADTLARKPKPLALYFFGKEKTAQAFCQKVPGGGVCVNDVIMHLTEHNLPFGGVGASGMGCYHGKYSFDTFTHYKAVLVKGKTELNVKYPPHTPKKLAFLKKFYKIRKK